MGSSRLTLRLENRVVDLEPDLGDTLKIHRDTILPSQALLQSWGLYGLIRREETRDRLLSAAKPLTAEDKQKCIGVYLSSLGISSEEELSRWMLSEALDQEQLQVRAERFLLWLDLCERRFRNQISSLFLKRKSSLDRVVYSLHWVDDEALAQELFIRLKERECTFEQLYCSLESSQVDGLPSGKQGPVALASVPAVLAEMLRVSEPGQVWPPRAAEGGWVIVQLEEMQPAVFNHEIRRDFALELGDRWLSESMQVAR